MKVNRTAYHWFADIFCVLLLVGVFLYLIMYWNAIADHVPGHYNADGVVDRWTNKKELFILLAVAWVMYGGITVVEQFPRLWNTGVTITKQNAHRVYATLKNMIVTIKWQMVLAFCVITLYSSLGKGLPKWFLSVFLIAIFATLIGFLVQLMRVK